MVSDDKANTSNEESTITNEPSKRRAETSVPVWQRRYKFVRDLNKGGMNKVTLVERCSDSPPVCVKFLNSGADPRTLEQECRALMRLRHPAIVSLLDFSSLFTVLGSTKTGGPAMCRPESLTFRFQHGN
jgi:hypothetical protein